MSDAGAATASILRAAAAGRRRRAFGRLATRNRLAVVAALALVTAVLAAVLAPWLPLVDPEKITVPTMIMRGEHDGIAGVDYADASIMPVQVLGADGTGQDSDIISGVVWATKCSSPTLVTKRPNVTASSAAPNA